MPLSGRVRFTFFFDPYAFEVLRADAYAVCKRN
jgi:hypothetical protein